YSLVPATLLAVGLAVGLGLYVQSRYGIGGPVYEQLAVQKEIFSAVEPAILALTKPVIILHSMEAQTNPDELAPHVAAIPNYEMEYRAARDKYLKSLPDGEARRLLERDLHRPAEEIFQIARTEYFPLLNQGQPGDRQKALQVLREKIMPRFQEVRRAGDRLF